MRLIVDLTDVLLFFQAHWTVSGIQRVSLRVAKLLLDHHGADNDIAIMAIDGRGRVTLGDARCLEPESVDRDRFVAAFTPVPSTLSAQIETTARTSLARLRRLGRRWRDGHPVSAPALVPGPEPDKLRGREVRPEDLKDATILVLGGVRPLPDYWDRMDELKRAGAARVVMTVHDLIPLLRTEMVPDDQPDIFYDGLHRAARSSDRFIAVSETTKRHLSAFLHTYGYRDRPVSVVPLAHEFVARASPPARLSPGTPPPLPLDVAETGGVAYADAVGLRRDVKASRLEPYVLTVGTIEPRKNFLRLAQVWQRLLEELGPEAAPRLVFAGKKAFGREAFDEFLRVTGSLGGFIRLIDAPSDEELSYLYRHCLFTVFPSCAEGWGLPVGESLWHGKLCVASRAWSIPEVGGALCDYFDPESPDDMRRALLAAIRDFEARRAKEEAIVKASLRRWADVAEDIWKVVAPAEAGAAGK